MLRVSALRWCATFATRPSGRNGERVLCSNGGGGCVVPSEPLPKAVQASEAVTLDQSTVELLERLSLVDFSNAEAVTRLEEAVKFASLIMNVDTTGVAPMVTPLENVPLRLRPDVPVECCAEEILKNAKLTEEGYFVAPPGNIPLDVKSDYGLTGGGMANAEK
nr:glutamyl-tRNA(Gln) amidotransferase subunit C, mitochondrial-like [Dermacentor andersoni]